MSIFALIRIDLKKERIESQIQEKELDEKNNAGEKKIF
jgi:hypothetical protein